MFTGIIEEIGVVKGVFRGPDSARISISAVKILDDMKIGDSIAVNGICLTVTERTNGLFNADAMAETLARTNLKTLKPGDKVNLERAVRLTDRLGGHLVSGHIDGTGTIARVERHDIAVIFTISAPPQIIKYMVKKGSVAVDGTSLTITELDGNYFRVSLIPHTARATILGDKKEGDVVNLESDLLAKYVERLLLAGRSGGEGIKSGITLDLLAENGFL